MKQRRSILAYILLAGTSPTKRESNLYKELCSWLIFFCMLDLLIPQKAYAYLDPGTGSMLLSACIGIAATAFFSIKKLFYAWQGFWYKLLGKKLPDEKTAISIYSEGANYWPSFQDIVHALLEQNQSVRYLSSDKNDPGLALTHPLYSSHYIGSSSKAFAILNTLEADICLSTTPGLDVLQIKRSPRVKHYGHIVHAVTDMAFYTVYAFDYYDSVFCAGSHQMQSLRELERKRKTKEKQLFATGCPYIDVMKRKLDQEKETLHKDSFEKKEKKHILLAPTWGKNGLLSRFGLPLLENIAQQGYELCIRPHPQSSKVEKELLERLKSKLAQYKNVSWDHKTSPLGAMLQADILLSDLSGIVFDYAFLLEKPVITIAFTPNKKGMDAADLEHIWELEVLGQLGAHIQESEVTQMHTVIEDLQADEMFIQNIRALRKKSLYNFAESGKHAAQQILQILVEIQKKEKKLNQDTVDNKTQ